MKQPVQHLLINIYIISMIYLDINTFKNYTELQD